MPAPGASGWSGRRVGLAPTGKAPPCHGARGKRTFREAVPASVVDPKPTLAAVRNRVLTLALAAALFQVDYLRSLREGGTIKFLLRNVSAIRRPSFKIGYRRVEAIRLEKTKRLSRLNQNTPLDKRPRM